jgi:hypothetical protein
MQKVTQPSTLLSNHPTFKLGEQKAMTSEYRATKSTTVQVMQVTQHV